MAILRSKEIAKMNENERKDKMQELKIELVKASIKNKATKSNPKEIKRTIARLMTFNTANKNKEKK